MQIKQFFEIQKKFNKKYFSDKCLDVENLSKQDRAKYSKEFITYLIKEASEILDNFEYKDYCKKDVEFIEYNLIENIIDVFKFLLCICNVNKIDYEDFEKVFLEKTEVVRQRYLQDNELDKIKKAKKIAAFDIDGVISVYPNHFIEYINKKLKTSYKNLFTIKDFVEEKKYREIKHEYRKSGEKLKIPLIESSKEVIDYFKNKGYFIVLITARPYDKYRRIYSDTLVWLKKNKIYFDHIFWSRNKSLKILSDVSNLQFIVEDNLDNANKISKMGYRVYLIDNQYNQGYTNKTVNRIRNIKEIIQMENMK